MKNSLLKNKNYKLWWLIFQTRRAMMKVWLQEMAQYGITPQEFAVLFVVDNLSGKAMPSEISRWLLLEPHATSSLLGRMVKKGLVRKDKNFDRKNLIRVTLTKKGREVYNRSDRLECIQKIMPILSRGEFNQLRICLEKIRDKTLKERGIKYKVRFPQF